MLTLSLAGHTVRRTFEAVSLSQHKLTVAHLGGSVAEWLACWTQARKVLGSNRSRDAVGSVLGKLFTPIVPLFTKQQNWQQPS